MRQEDPEFKGILNNVGSKLFLLTIVAVMVKVKMNRSEMCLYNSTGAEQALCLALGFNPVEESSASSTSRGTIGYRGARTATSDPV